MIEEEKIIEVGKKWHGCHPVLILIVGRIILHEEGAMCSMFFSMHFLVITSMVQVECVEECVSLLGHVLLNFLCFLGVYLCWYAPTEEVR